MKIKDKLSATSTVLALALAGAKTVTDVRRHRTHAPHSQKCDCFAMCYACAFSPAPAQERARRSAARIIAASEPAPRPGFYRARDL
jgi:hypothetical protein